MKATLHNLTNVAASFDGQDLTSASQPLACTDPLPQARANEYLLVPACVGPAAHTRADIVWSASIPYCRHCAPAPAKRSWFSKLANRPSGPPDLHVVEHYTLQDGRQGIGAAFFRQRYLQ